MTELEATLGSRQPSLSQHLGSLREAGIIAGRHEAKAVFYRVSDPRAAAVVEALHAIFCEARLGTRAARPGCAGMGTTKCEGVSRRAAELGRGEAAVFAVVEEEA